jgi:TolA-binding protein
MGEKAMAWWPGWNSVDSATAWSNFWFWCALLCLLALGASGVLSHVYGLRKEALIEMAARGAEAERQRQQVEQQREAEQRHASKLAELGEQLSRANNRVAELQKGQAQRHLSLEQQAAIVAAISRYAGQKIALISVVGNAEARRYRDEFVKVFDAAGWDHRGDSGVLEANYPYSLVGVELTLHQVNTQQGRTNAAINALIKVLGDLNLFGGGGARMNALVPDGEVELRVGLNPAFHTAN